MKILLSIILIILVTNTISCSSKQKVIYKTKYVKQECYNVDNIPDKPIPDEYHSIVIKYNDNYYYCLDEDNAKLMIGNWLDYKLWCETIYTILTTKENK